MESLILPLKKTMNSCRRWLSNFFGRGQDIRIIRKIFADHAISRHSSILDFGCGSGRLAASLLKDGYINLHAYDVNPETFKDPSGTINRFINLQDLFSHPNTFDVILLIHVIEHIAPGELADLLQMLIERLSSNGVLIVASPTHYPIFYNDFDHIKPYTPLSIASLFCRSDTIYKSNTKQLLDPQYLRYRRRPLVLTDWQGAASMGFQTSLIDDLSSCLLNILAGILFIISLGFVSTRSAWYASFLKHKPIK